MVDYRIKDVFILIAFLLIWHVLYPPTPFYYYTLFTIAKVARYHLLKSPINNKNATEESQIILSSCKY